MSGRKRHSVYRTMVIGKKPLANLPKPLTYVAQAFWPARPSYELEDGNLRRSRQKRRIAGDPAIQVYLWLHEHQLSDLIMMIGLRATTRGFIVRKRAGLN